ncbi:MAG TPA: hypothetical protein VIV11_38685 [Kofleriaceae bacterium]
MRALLLIVFVAGCGSERIVQSVTIARVDVSHPACEDSHCHDELGLYQVCSGNFFLIKPEDDVIVADTGVPAADVAHLVQLQYYGAVVHSNARPHLDYVLRKDDTAAVVAAYDEPNTVLYRIDSRGAVIDIDTDRLESATDRTLRFHYPPNVREEHVIDKPRPVTVDVGESFPFCCSVGSAGNASIWLVVLLFTLRRRARRSLDVRSEDGAACSRMRGGHATRGRLRPYRIRRAR